MPHRARDFLIGPFRKTSGVARSWGQSLYAACWFSLSAATLVLAIGCQSDRGDDLLILRDGATKQGRLDHCAGQTCTFNGSPIPRRSIQFIGLNKVKAPPPPVQDRLQDEVRLIDGSTHPGQVAVVDAKHVYTPAATYPRERVAWIYLARTEEPDRPASAVPQGRTGAGSASEPQDKASYLWDGRIEVENTYNGRNGRHKWTGEFLVKFLEVRSNSRKMDGRPISRFVPLELNYVIHADQNWNKGSYALQRGANNAIISGDVTMRGQASGAFTADQLKKGRMLGGDIVTLDAPAATPITAPTTFASGVDASGYMAADPPPGFYRLWGSLRSYQSERVWPHRSPERAKLLRDLYQGIDRGGQQPMWTSSYDANQDFGKWVVLEGFLVFGHLNTPDQAEVRGTYSEPMTGGVSSGDNDAGRITHSWVFKRTRK